VGNPHDRQRHLHHRRNRHRIETGNGGPAFLATVYFAISSGTDNHGDLYIGDQYGGQLREIPPPPPPSRPHPT
jgi:hypothetical protein